MQRTFRKKDILALFESNPNAKNMIVKFDKPGKKEFTARMQKMEEDTEEIEGCPFPPGCTDDEG